MNELLHTINAIDWTLFGLLVICYACKNTWRQRYYNATSYRRQQLTYPSVNISSILTEPQLTEVEKILKKSLNGEDCLLHLKQYFLSIKEQLKVKGVLDEYLAWVVFANWKKMEEL